MSNHQPNPARDQQWKFGMVNGLCQMAAALLGKQFNKTLDAMKFLEANYASAPANYVAANGLKVDSGISRKLLVEYRGGPQNTLGL